MAEFSRRDVMKFFGAGAAAFAGPMAGLQPARRRSAPRS